MLRRGSDSLQASIGELKKLAEASGSHERQGLFRQPTMLFPLTDAGKRELTEEFDSG